MHFFNTIIMSAHLIFPPLKISGQNPAYLHIVLRKASTLPLHAYSIFRYACRNFIASAGVYSGFEVEEWKFYHLWARLSCTRNTTWSKPELTHEYDFDVEERRIDWNMQHGYSLASLSLGDSTAKHLLWRALILCSLDSLSSGDSRAKRSLRRALILCSLASHRCVVSLSCSCIRHLRYMQVLLLGSLSSTPNPISHSSFTQTFLSLFSCFRATTSSLSLSFSLLSNERTGDIAA